MRSYPAAMRELGKVDRREMGRWMNNRAENSHLPFRQTFKERRSAALAKWQSLAA